MIIDNNDDGDDDALAVTFNLALENSNTCTAFTVYTRKCLVVH